MFPFWIEFEATALVQIVTFVASAITCFYVTLIGAGSRA